MEIVSIKRAKELVQKIKRERVRIVLPIKEPLQLIIEPYQDNQFIFKVANPKDYNSPKIVVDEKRIIHEIYKHRKYVNDYLKGVIEH